jgi:hypothetical protein
MLRKLTTILGPVAIVCAVVVAPIESAALALAPTQPAMTEPECELPTGELTTSDLPEGSDTVACDATGRIVDVDGASLPVPEPGMGVVIEVDYSDRSESAAIEVHPDGTISYDAPDNETISDPDKVRDSCTDDAYNLDGGRRWYSNYAWYLGDGSRPGNMSSATTYVVLADAVSNITNSTNPCGLTDSVTATYSYEGATVNESDIHTDFGTSSCDFWTDGKNVVDFGDLSDDGNPPWAITCKWYGSQAGANHILQADVKFNVVDFDWTRDVGPTCNQQVDLESVATHEFGHVYGLQHVDSDNHPTLTMRTGGAVCQTFKRTLGLGDVRGLRSLY